MDSLEDYLATLPQGLQSFPEAKVKASTIVGFFDEAAITPHLPLPVVASIVGMPASSWIPEVHVSVAHLVMRARCFESDDAFVESARAHNSRLLNSPLYRSAFRLFQPGRIARIISGAWGLFRRGSSIQVRGETPNSVSFSLHHPANIWPSIVRRGLLTCGAEAMRVGGTETARTTLEVETETYVHGLVEW